MAFRLPSLERLAINLIDYGLLFVSTWPGSLKAVWIRYNYPYSIYLGIRLIEEYYEINQWISDNLPERCDRSDLLSPMNPFRSKTPYTILEGEMRFRDLSMATMFTMRFGGEHSH